MIFSEMRRTYKQVWPMADTDPATDTGDPTNTVINADLHAAARHIYGIIAATMPERVASTDTYTLVSGGEVVTIDAGMLKIINVRARPTGSDGDPFMLRATRRGGFVNYPQHGSPEVYARLGNDLYLRPAPVTSYDILIDVITEYAELADNAAPSWLPARHHEIIPYRAALMRKRILGDNVTGVEKTFDEMLSTLVQDLEESIPDTGVNLDDALGDYYE